jgi:hypothetical protein
LIAFEVAEETVGFTPAAAVPWRSVRRIAHREGSVVSIEDGLVLRKFISKLISIFIVIKIPFTVVFSPSSSGMATSTMLKKIERGFINFGGMGVPLFCQLARIRRGQAVLPIHSRGKVPGVFLIKRIGHHNFPGPIGSAKLEVVAHGDSVVIMAAAAGFPWTVRHPALQGKRISIESP